MKKYSGLFLLILSIQLFALQSPDEFFGVQLGADRVLLNYYQIQQYLSYLEKETGLLQLINLGRTTLQNDFVMAVVSAKENLLNLEKIKKWNRQLTYAEVDQQEAKKIVQQTRPVIFITCNLHSSEIASSQMVLKFLHQLLQRQDQLVLCIVPSVNPDGQLMEVNWYQKYLHTPYEGSELPYLYHHYAGHDNNRDWFKLSLKETNLLVEQLYRNFFPQLILDIHQMGWEGDRFFIPPFQDPATPHVHPLVWRMINFIGANIALQMEQNRLSGVSSRGYFTGWWIGSLDDSGWFHNIPGILFEAASVKLATPIYIEKEEIVNPESINNEEVIFSPNPWKGGWWRLADIINYELIATRGLLEAVLLKRDELLWNLYQIALDNIARGFQESPYGYIIPYYQRDQITARRLVEVLLKNGIIVKQLQHPVRIGNQIFDKRSFYVPLAQPYRSFAKNLLDKQYYPDLRQSKEDRPKLPYDMAAWTLSLGMGVEVYALKDAPLKAVVNDLTLENLWQINYPQEKEQFILLDSRENWSFFAVFGLLKRGVKVYRTVHPAKDFAAGSFFVPAAEAEKYLSDLQKIHPFLYSFKKELPEDARLLTKKLVGLYQNYGHNMAEGWLRYLFDQFQIDYLTLRAEDFKNGKKVSQCDLLCFVGASSEEIEEGKSSDDDAQWFGNWPPQYRQGIGKEGQKLLEKFLKAGKDIVFMSTATEYAIKKFKLPVDNVIKEKKGEVICPGSYLKALVKPSELTLGMPEEVAVFYRENPVFQTRLPASVQEERRTAMVFPTRELLLSGWLQGEDALSNAALVVDYAKEKGRIVLIGPDLVHRTHSEGTYKIIFNTLLRTSLKKD